MSMLRTVMLTVALIAGTTSLTMAQNSPGATGDNTMPPSRYLGPAAYPSYKSSNFQQAANPAVTGGRRHSGRGRH